MAPKNNAKGGDKKGPAKGKGKDAGEDAGGKGKGKGGLKAASSINVRHILVRFLSVGRPAGCLLDFHKNQAADCMGSNTSTVRETLQERRGTREAAQWGQVR